MQRHPENEQHHEHGTDAVDHGTVRNGCEFLVGDRNRSGQPHPGAVLAGEIEVFGGLPDGVGRVLAGLERVEIEHRLEFDKGAPVGIGQRLVADQFAPGEGPRAGLEYMLHGVGDLRERPRGAVEFEFPALDADKPGLERAGQSTQARVTRHDFDQRRGRGELAGELGDLRLGQEQEPVLFEEFS